MSEGRWTQDDVAKLVAMLRDGRTTEEAANALGRTVPAIWQYMRYHRQAFQGLPERRGGARGRAAHPRQTIAALRAGRSCAGRAVTTSVTPCRTSRRAAVPCIRMAGYDRQTCLCEVAVRPVGAFGNKNLREQENWHDQERMFGSCG